MSAYLELERHFTKLDHLNHLARLAIWDEAVMMPPGGGIARGKAMSTLSAISHEMLCNKKTGDLIAKAKDESLSDPWQIRNLYWMDRKYKNATCLPVELVAKMTKASVTCEQAWRKMRAENNWADFKPLLAECIKLTKEAANIRSDIFHIEPYDLMLDDFSPGINRAIINPIFAELKSILPNLIDQVLVKQQAIQLQAFQGPFLPAQQKALGMALMKVIGFDFNHGRLDVSHHPFCDGGPDDIRITTRYNDNDFISSAMAICHETGHAMYEFGLPEKYREQLVGKALGMSLHESQSLLIEMQACRSVGFMSILAKHAAEQFGAHPAFNAENLYHHYTRVKPNLIRVEADELTYPLHVILRYEIECALFNNEITVDDLPAMWDEKMQDYLNLDTKNNFKDSVMQDVHWPSAAFGYFPAYTLGALIAAQLFTTAVKTHPEIPNDISRGDFSQLFQWLRKHVHGQGSLLEFNDLIKQATGEELNPAFYLNHINARYLS